jgi:acyl-CoA reductase-like NAD-dependent aldehyde dehydrogenase
MARQDGAPRLDRKGHFMAATAFADVQPTAGVAQREIFGPVLCVTPFDTGAERIAGGIGTSGHGPEKRLEALYDCVHTPIGIRLRAAVA